MDTGTVQRPSAETSGMRPSSPAHGSITFIGAAATLIRLGTFTVLTDPDFLHAGDRARLGFGLHSERLTEPALQPSDLPPLDLCVLSHMHGDHWDRIAAAELPRSLPIVTTHEAATVLAKQGFARRHPLDTWQSFTLPKAREWLRVTSLPARHGPSLVASLMPQTMGSMIEIGRDRASASFRICVSGDTLFYEALRRIPLRYPSIDIGIVHLGGMRLAGVTVTMDASQGVEWLRTIRPGLAVPVHYDDYRAFKSPLAAFTSAAEGAGLEAEVRVVGRGETLGFEVPSE